MADHLNPAPEERAAGDDGLSHYGEPEVEVIEEAPSSTASDSKKPRVPRAPRAPTKAEREAHMATHLPHESWCRICMKGRGRNKPHRARPNRWARTGKESSPSSASPHVAGEVDSDPECSESEGELSSTAGDAEDELHSGPVPRVSMDYFYLSKKGASGMTGAKAMSTKELQKRLREMGKSDRGSRTE